MVKVRNPQHLLTPNHEGKMPNDLLVETLHRLGGNWKESDLHLDHFR
jgi:hypothetical protein